MDRLLESVFGKTKKSPLLLGPRQVGKNTLLRSKKPDLILNLANEVLYLELLAHPEYFFSMINGAMAKGSKTKKHIVVLVDEIQRIPSLLNSIQAILDETIVEGKTNLQFLISGSSARKLKRGGANLLPGRVLQYKMGGLSILEMKEKWNVERALSLGTLPEPYLGDDEQISRKLLESYAGTYLKEEIQTEAESLSLVGFSRFIFKAAENSGNILDFTKISNQAKVSRTSCKRYYEILEDSLIVYRCIPYQPENGPESIKHSRFYLFDPGVWNGFMGNFIPSEDRKGTLFEHLVISQLHNTAFAKDRNIEVGWYRSRHGHEVDFILRFSNSKKIIPIEVKSGSFQSKDLNGLERFYLIDKNVQEGFLIYPTLKVPRKIGKTHILSLADAIEKIFA